MFRPCYKFMKGEVKIESLEQRSSSCFVSLLLLSISDSFLVQSLALTLTLILVLTRTLAEVAAPALALTPVLLLTGLSFWHWL